MEQQTKIVAHKGDHITVTGPDGKPVYCGADQPQTNFDDKPEELASGKGESKDD